MEIARGWAYCVDECFLIRQVYRERDWFGSVLLYTGNTRNINKEISRIYFQYVVTILVLAAVANAVPIELGHYGPAPILAHASPLYAHGHIAKHVIAEPVVWSAEYFRFTISLTNYPSSATGLSKILIQLWHQRPTHRWHQVTGWRAWWGCRQGAILISRTRRFRAHSWCTYSLSISKIDVEKIANFRYRWRLFSSLVH